MLLSFLVSALVAAVVIWVIYTILGMLKLPQPINTIVYVIVGIGVLIWLLRLLVIPFPIT